MNGEMDLSRSRLTTPRDSDRWHFVFSAAYHQSGADPGICPRRPQDSGAWLSNSWKGVNLALNILPFTGVAFYGSSVWCAIGLGSMRIVSLPPYSWAVGYCFWQCCLSLQR